MPAKAHGPDPEVDVEHPAPADVFREPAADHGAEHRPHHDGDAEHRHGGTALLGRIDVEKDRLGERYQGGPEHALEQTEADDLQQGLRDAAEDRRHDEAGHGRQQHPLAPELAGEIARWRRHDGGRGDVGRENPIDLVGRGRDAALDVGQRHIGDGSVQRLHHDGQDHAGRDGAPIGDSGAAVRQGRRDGGSRRRDRLDELFGFRRRGHGDARHGSGPAPNRRRAAPCRAVRGHARFRRRRSHSSQP